MKIDDGPRAADDDLPSLDEAQYLLLSPENARRLLAAIDRLERGSPAPDNFSD